MKYLLTIIYISLSFNISYAQASDIVLLKKYKFYVEENIEIGKWKTKYYLKEGLVIAKESYWKNKLRRRVEYRYDDHQNITQERETFNINKGKVNKVSEIKLEYENGKLVKREFDYGVIEKYSDLNELGKPKLTERFSKGPLSPMTYKEIIEYDPKGNIVKSIKYSIYKDFSGTASEEIAITSFKYDKQNNIVEIHHQFEPRQKFPIPITGGPSLYEFEYYRYKYNKEGLWIRKYKTVDGKEHLIKKREYK